MKSNFGDKLQALALIIGIVEVLTALVAGASLLAQGGGYRGNDSLQTIGWIVLVGGSFLSIVSCMILYGFGVLVERTQKIHELLLQKQEEIEVEKPEEQEIPTGVSEARRTWICPTCGYRNDISTMYCLNCKKR